MITCFIPINKLDAILILISKKFTSEPATSVYLKYESVGLLVPEDVFRFYKSFKLDIN